LESHVTTVPWRCDGTTVAAECSASLPSPLVVGITGVGVVFVVVGVGSVVVVVGVVVIVDVAVTTLVSLLSPNAHAR
jgi:hypothetical protein